MLKREDKKAAIEMSVGTIVTIVLSMTLLIGLLFFIGKIVSSGSGAIDSIDAQLQSQINKLISEGQGTKKIVVFPSSQEISLKKGDSPKGFGISISNRDSSPSTFSYNVVVKQGGVPTNCAITTQQAESYIILGKSEDGISLGSGDVLDPARIVKFDIPETAGLCTIRYTVEVSKNGQPGYASSTMDVTIK